ncbi:hypothetical protein B0H11DRAFT_2431861 [Mycena galericulata]|nr:hypothetical protein B0H11DRAFT_2431861 [Mycena galericulata]
MCSSLIIMVLVSLKRSELKVVGQRNKIKENGSERLQEIFATKGLGGVVVKMSTVSMSDDIAHDPFPYHKYKRLISTSNNLPSLPPTVNAIVAAQVPVATAPAGPVPAGAHPAPAAARSQPGHVVAALPMLAPTTLSTHTPPPLHQCTMPTNVAIVDDRDPSIIYEAHLWALAGTLEEFNSTTTHSTTQGSTASFTFVGTSITVYATVEAAAAKKQPQTSLYFAIDNNGALTGTYTPPNNMSADIHHTALWESPTLSNGPHKLVITQTVPQVTSQVGGVIFLDYFMYNTTSTEVDAYFIDDSDPRVSYTPAWQHFTGDQDFQHTSQQSTNPGDMFSLTFQVMRPLRRFVLPGKAIKMYGSITDIGMKASMVVDGGVAEVFAPSSLPESVTNNLIFSSGVLDDGNHTLVVTSEGTSPMWMDYVLVTPSTLLNASPTSSGSSASSTLPATSSTAKSTPIGTIVGGVVGGLVVIAALAGAAIFSFRRRTQNSMPFPITMRHDVTPTPFSGFLAARRAAILSPSVSRPRKLAEVRRGDQFAPSMPGTGSQPSSTDTLIPPDGGDSEAPPSYSE